MILCLRVIALAPNSWQGQWVNRQQLLSRLGSRHSILYSTGGWFSWDRHNPAWRSSKALGGFALMDGVWVDSSPKYLMRMTKLPLLDQAIMRLQAMRWMSWLDRQGDGPLILHLFHPSFFPYLEHVKADVIVYHAYDLFQRTPGWTTQLASYERNLLERADLVVTSSQAMADGLSQIVRREIRVLPNGADVDAFSLACTEPDDLRGIQHPRIGYLGSLHPQVDYGLIATLARREPNWQFVLVGQIISPGGREGQSLDECRDLANVHLLGGKPHSNMPAYASNMDVNVMCYRLDADTWIKAGYPLKLHEYLAAGHPVVSSDLITVREFSRVVRIAEGVEDWSDAIDEALQEGGRGTRDERQAVARENSWEARARQLESWWQQCCSSDTKATSDSRSH